MLEATFVNIVQEALWLVLVLAGPPVAIAAIVGLIIALFQSATQLQEPSLQYAAKFFTIMFTLFVMASLLGGALYQFSDQIFTQFPTMIGS